jgi:hypothetical protein
MINLDKFLWLLRNIAIVIQLGTKKSETQLVHFAMCRSILTIKMKETINKRENCYWPICEQRKSEGHMQKELLVSTPVMS